MMIKFIDFMVFCLLVCSIQSRTIRFKNQATGYFLESSMAGGVYASTDGGKPSGRYYTRGIHQCWAIVNTQPNAFFLQNCASKLYLSSDWNGNVNSVSSNDGDHQKWRFSNLRIVNVATGLALDSNHGKSVYTHRINGGNFQNWIHIHH